MRIELKTSLEPANKERVQGMNFLYGLLRICPNCDTELYAVWAVPYSFVEDSVNAEIRLDEIAHNIFSEEHKIIRNSKCPVCGAEADITLEWDVFRGREEWGKPIYYDTEFRLKKQRLEEKRRDAAIQRARALYEESNFPATDKVEGPKDEICASSEKLKRYLAQLIRLEVNIYSLSERLGRLYYEREQIDKKNIQEIGMLTKRARDMLASAEKRLNEVRKKGIKVEKPVEPPPPELKKPNLFNKSKVLAENGVKTKQYNEAMAEYQRRLAICNAEEKRLTQQAISEAEERLRLAKAQLEKQKAAAVSAEVPSTALRISADGEIAEAEKCLKESLKARNELYSYNVVFGKYRDLVAISTFYEYLMAGRCTALEGVNGAYNLYEYEIRANMIISQLTVIIRKLNQIEATQYTLYSELNKVNQSLSRISSKMDTAIQALDRIGDNTEQIAYNTEVAAFYTKKNAELTDALGYMVAFK